MTGYLLKPAKLFCMMGIILGFRCLGLVQSLTVKPSPQEEDRVLTGWGGGEPQEIVPKAALVGFQEIVVWNQDPAYLKKLVAVGQKYGIRIYASLSLGDVEGWRVQYPKASAPLQEINAKEQEALERILADKTLGKSKYQVGGEPVQDLEVLTTPLLCFHDPRVVGMFKRQIEAILTVPGIDGVALDYFGYRNYRCCRCPCSMTLLGRYLAAHPKMPKDVAQDRFSLETLVNVNNKLAEYVRTIRPDAKVINHVYPVFLPEPLYGNRLNVDVCGQTAAWFFEPFWDLAKIERYARIINENANQYYPRARGAALIGFFDQPKEYPVKSPARVDAELNAILAGGCARIQVCVMNDVLSNPQVSEVFKRYFKKSIPLHRKIAK